MAGYTSGTGQNFMNSRDDHAVHGFHEGFSEGVPWRGLRVTKENFSWRRQASGACVIHAFFRLDGKDTGAGNLALCSGMTVWPRVGDMEKIIVWVFAGLVALNAHADDWLYRMQPGDSIWNISHEYLKDPGQWSSLQRLNQVNNDRGMPVGSPLRIPEAWLVWRLQEAIVATVSGDVRVITGGQGKPRPLDADTRLGERDIIVTSADGGAGIRLPDGSLVVVSPSSRVRVDRLREYGRNGKASDTRLYLRNGGLENQVNPKRGAADRFEIETPAAVTAVRGTHYRLAASRGKTADAPAEARAEVLRGDVDVENSAGKVSVKAGFGILARAGQAPEKPRKLLPAPRLELKPLQRGRSLVVAWRAVPRASGYQAQLALDSEFTHIVRDQRVAAGQLRLAFDGLDDAEYQLRLVAIDAVGLRGRSALARVELDAHPWAPELVAPADGAAFQPGKARLQWRAGDAESRRFRVQIARNSASSAGFSHPLLDRVVDDTAFQPPADWPAGEYRWRVAAIDASGDQGVFSPSRRFLIRKPLPAPEFSVDLVKDPARGGVARALVHLPAPRSGLKYQVRLSEEPDGGDLLLDKRVDGGDIDIELKDPGVAWLRARLIDENTGAKSRYSEAVKLENPSDRGRWVILIGALLMALL